MKEHFALNQGENFSTVRLLRKAENPFIANFKKYGGLRTKGWEKQSTDKEPVISIITVVRNDVAHIEETILSVLNQTYNNVEYVIVDGDSTDGTLEIIKKYEQYIDLWVSEPDGGIYDAWNKGADLVTGTWVNYLNCGDYFFDNTLFEKIFSADHGSTDLLYGGFIGNFNGKPVKCIAPDTVRDSFWKGMPFCHGAVFARTALVKKFKFNTKIKVSADGEFMARCAASGCVFKRLDMIVFRVGTLGFSNKNWLKGQLENWTIARSYFPGIKTDLFHFQRLLREVGFRTFKYLASLIGLYQLARFVYRKKIQKKIPLLPKNVLPFEE